MAVNRVPVLKRCRSLGLEPGFLGIDKRSNRELRRANRKMSEYGSQLREKQKAKFIYGVLEKPFRNYFEKASRMRGQVGENLMILLESRLDNVIFRLGWARTRREARQIVGHRHVLVNGKIVNIPSYLIKAGDTIEIKDGKVFLNQQLLNEDYILEKTLTNYPLSTVPAGHIFVMGDNRNNSEDSRFADVGFVPYDLIKGKAMVVFWPVAEAKSLP